MNGKSCRSSLTIFLAVLVALAPVAPVYAQQGAAPPPTQPQPAEAQPPTRQIVVSNQDFTFGKRWFPNILEPYTPTPVPEPILTNAPRIEQMVKDGKLTMSLQDAVDLALQNNLAIVIERYVPWIEEASILHTLSGGAPISGSVGALGTIPVPSFDPILTSNLSLDQKLVPANNGLTSGTGTTAGTFAQLNTHTAVADFAYTQGFHTGTSFSATFNNVRGSSSSANNFFSPFVQSNFIFLASQQLLNGFGLAANEHYIRIAKVNKNIADQQLAQQVITSITAVENAYWELVFARGNVEVAKEEIALAEKTYSDNKKQVDVGTLAPLEIVQAEAQLATAQEALIVAQTTVLQDQLTLLNLIAKDPNAPVLRNVEIVPTDIADVAPPEVENIPLEDLIKEAVTKRPDVLQGKLLIQGDQVNMQATRNALLPILTLSGEYATEGLAGNSKPGTCAPTPCTPPPQIFSGLPTALNQEFSGVYPEYNAQLSLTIPIRNRAAQANNVLAILNQRSDEATYQQIVNNAATDVHNAQITLEQARITLAAAVKTRDLDQQTLDAEQKKYQVGASTLFNIVSDQNILAAAESAEVRARVNLAEGKVNFDRAMARTLEVYNITIADAKSGRPIKDTLIPGTSAGGQLFVDPVKRTSASSLSSGYAPASAAGNAQ
ncbi:MAG TPA: TolC family protein [Verrucomicrobiae bacterium]|jgi:outer membrane protein|nr:TolC family protein [Verrucomicrobiae bacterium]